MSTAPRGPEAVLVDVLADLANAGLDLDPSSHARLARLEGRRVQISTRLPPLGNRDFTLTVTGGRLRCFAHAMDTPHVIVRGEPPALAAWLLGAGSTGPLGIDGDAAVLGELTALLRDFQPDLGGPLERLLGAELTRTALGTAELALAGLRSALQGAGRSVRDGAVQTFVDRAGMDRLLDELDDLRLRADRLGARVGALEQHRKSS